MSGATSERAKLAKAKPLRPESVRKLSPREIQVAVLLCDGHSQKTAAHALKLSPHTVHHYVESFRLKMGGPSLLFCLLKFREAFSGG